MNKELQEHFIEPETRGDTYVSAELKAAWKVMLDILKVFSDVCEKYRLKWWMEGGSLLGAVRHQGFIPWDDDLDVSMPRDDYEKLQKVLPAELPQNYFMQTTATEPEYYLEWIRIRNSETCGIDPLYAKYHYCFDMGIFIDVHPVDLWIDDERRRKRIFRRCLFWRGVMRNSNAHTLESHSGMSLLRHYSGRLILSILKPKGIYWLRESFFRRHKDASNGKSAVLPAHYGWSKNTYLENEWITKTIEVPFEYLTVKIPAGYEKRLEVLYGDWRKPCKSGSYHGNLILDAKRSYKDILRERFGYTEAELKRCRG